MSWLLGYQQKETVMGGQSVKHAVDVKHLFIHTHTGTEELWERNTTVSTTSATAVFSVRSPGVKCCWIHAISPVGGKFLLPFVWEALTLPLQNDQKGNTFPLRLN